MKNRGGQEPGHTVYGTSRNDCHVCALILCQLAKPEDMCRRSRELAFCNHSRGTCVHAEPSWSSATVQVQFHLLHFNLTPAASVPGMQCLMTQAHHRHPPSAAVIALIASQIPASVLTVPFITCQA